MTKCFGIVGMAALVGAALYVSSAARAATETKNLTVTVQVVDLCNLTLGASTLSFGSIEPLEQVDAQVNVNVNCTSQVVSPPTVTVGNGFFFGRRTSFVNSRAMLRAGGDGNNQTDFLAYNFFSDAARTALIGSNGNLPLSVPNGASFSGVVNAVLYARIPQSQNVLSGNFSDTVAITLTYQPF